MYGDFTCFGPGPAQNFEEISQVVHAFCEEHHDLRIAVVTSGGTIVPLERNMGEIFGLLPPPRTPRGRLGRGSG